MLPAPAGTGFEPQAASETTALVFIRAMIAAAAADGHIDAEEREAILGGLKEANLDGARLVGTDLGADPANQGMVPVRVDMSRATLNGADLTGANLVHVVLAFVKLRGAKLKDAKLGWANLSGAELEGADVSGADFTDADLEGASLAGIRGAETAKGLEEAK